MMISRRRRSQSGPEALVNGNFEAGASNWTVSGADATHVATFSGGRLRFQSDTTTPQLIVSQSNIAVVGRLYRVTAVCALWTSGSVKIFDNGASLVVGGVGTFSAVIRATQVSLAITRNTANVDLTLESVSLIPIG